MAFAPVSADAQEIRGRIIEFETGVPVAGAEVVLLTEGDTVRSTGSGANGGFFLTAPGPGVWSVAASFIGYRPVGPVPIALAEGEVVTLQLSLAIEPVEMEALVVVARRGFVNSEFERRRDSGERSGMGNFLYGEELQRRGSARPSDVLATIPGVRSAEGSVATGRIVRMQGGCIPDVYLDGMHLNRMNWAESLDPYVNTRDIEGIEVYRGSERAEGFFDPDGCGLILVWTKNWSLDPESAGAVSGWKKIGVALGIVITILTLKG